jgi:DNA repair protein RadC
MGNRYIHLEDYMTYQIVSERKLKHEAKIKNPIEVFELVKRYAASQQEHFILLTLNGSHIVISISIITIGLVNRTIVHPREVFCRAISDRASAIIVCHNHPSGALIPSKEDKQITERIYKAGVIIGIPLLDHVVFSETDFASMRQQGDFLKNWETEEF